MLSPYVGTLLASGGGQDGLARAGTFFDESGPIGLGDEGGRGVLN